MLVEDVINSPGADIKQRLNALVASYEEVIRSSALGNMDSLNYWLRQELSNLRGFRRQYAGRDDMLETLFSAYEEKLFRLCLKEEGRGFVKAIYLPPSELI